MINLSLCKVLSCVCVFFFSNEMFCKIENCQCQKQEISIHLLYWLSHQGIDIRPLFQRPYIIKKRKVSSNNNNDVQESTMVHFTDSVQNENGLEEFLWSMPQLETMTTTTTTTPQPPQTQTSVKRSVPFKVPSSNSNVRRRV